MKHALLLTIAAVGLSLSGVRADTLTTTFEGGNGNDGIMFNVTAVKKLTVTAIQSALSTDGTKSVEIYTKPGTHVGFEANAAAWTLVGGGTVTSAVDDAPFESLQLSLPVEIAAGAQQAFYVHVRDGSISYTNGSGTGTLQASDANLLIFEGVGVDTLFSGADNQNRIPNVTIEYNPEIPTDLANPTIQVFGKKKINTSTPGVTIYGLATDDTSVASVKATIKLANGKKVKKNAKLYPGGLFKLKARFPEGVSRITLRAVDRDGKFSKTIKILVTR